MQLAKRSPSSVAGNIITLGILWWGGEIGSHRTEFAATIVLSIAFLALVRGVQGQQLLRNYDLWKSDSESLDTWENSYSLVVTLKAALWGTLLIHSLDYASQQWLTFTLAVIAIAGLAAGTTVSLASHARLYLAFSTASLILPSLYILLSPEHSGIKIIGGFGLLYAAFMFSQARSTRKVLAREAEDRRSIEAEQENLQTLLDTIPGFVSWLDKNLCYQRVNQETLRASGAKVESFIGKPLGFMGNDPAFVEKIREFMKSDLEAETFEIQLALKGIAGPKWCQMSLKKSYNPETSELTGVVAVTLDIDHEKALEVENDQQRARASHNAKMASLGEMAGGIAHEINNPLAIIQGKVEQMRERQSAGKLDTAQIDRGLEMIEKSSRRISKIVKGLKSFSRNGEKDPFQRISVQQIIEDTLSFCREKIEQNGITFEVILEPELVIEARETQISQVILNLIQNSNDALLEKPAGSEKNWIRVEAKKILGERVILSVTDSGPGIPPEAVSRLMQPFFTTKPVGKGTGLGLSISRGIAEEHHGKFFYDDRSRNTRFCLELPLKQPASRKEQATESESHSQAA
jgi:signal transduction histidine kinase